MKNRIALLCAIALIICTKALGQENEKGNSEMRFSTSYDFGLKSGMSGMIGFQPEYGHYFANNVYLGIGSGVVVDDGFNNFFVPIFAHAELNIPTTGTLTPYVSLQAGYDISTGDATGYVRLRPSMGIKVPVGKTTLMNVGFGYTRTIADGNGADFLGFNVGLNFNSKGKGLGKFIGKLVYSAEMEMYTNVDMTESFSGGGVSSTFNYGFSSIYGIRLSALLPVINNLYIGPSVGMGVFIEEQGSDKFTEIYYNLMLRCKYRVNQINIMGKIVPFVQVDGGYSNFRIGEGITVAPAIGASLDLSNKQAVDLSIGYQKLPGENKSKGSFRIALGYQF